MKAIILAAGESKRLMPYTKDRPKCLLEICGKPIINYQIESFHSCGIKDIVIVTGHGDGLLREKLGNDFHYIFNEKYKSTSSIYSLWLAREALSGNSFFILNSDVLFHPLILKELLNFKEENCITVDFKDGMGEEEMKVKVKDGKVIDMSKAIPPSEAQGENVGLIKFGVDGGKILYSIMDRIISEGRVNEWAPYAFKEMTKVHPLHAVSTGGLPWIEIDFPQDLEDAREKVYPKIAGGI